MKIFDNNFHIKGSSKNLIDYIELAKKHDIIGASLTCLDPKENKLIENSFNFDFKLNFTPIFDTRNLYELKSLYDSNNFKSIKIHPRFSNINYNELINEKDFFNFLIDNNIILKLCTYYHNDKAYPESDVLYEIVKIKNRYKNLRMILLHSGDTRIVEFAQFARHFPDIFLDFSYTLTKYNSKYIKNQIDFCFNELDEKCLLGSDYPYSDIKQFVSRVKEITIKLPKIKRNNICFLNAINLYEGK